jgi:hypothetical protein
MGATGLQSLQTPRFVWKLNIRFQTDKVRGSTGFGLAATGTANDSHGFTVHDPEWMALASHLSTPESGGNRFGFLDSLATRISFSLSF